MKKSIKATKKKVVTKRKKSEKTEKPKKVSLGKLIKYKKLVFTADVGNGVCGSIKGVEMYLVKKRKGIITVADGPDSHSCELVFDLEDKDYEMID